MSFVLEEMRLTRDAIRYGFAVGKVRVLETRAVDRPALERLLDASTFAEQKRLLSETPYGRFLEGVETAEQVERALDEALDSWFRFLKDAELPQEVAEYFRVQYDYNNLRAAAKAQLLGVPLDGLLTRHGSVPIEEFSADLGALPGSLGAVARSFAARSRRGPLGRRDIACDRRRSRCGALRRDAAARHVIAAAASLSTSRRLAHRSRERPRAGEGRLRRAACRAHRGVAASGRDDERRVARAACRLDGRRRSSRPSRVRRELKSLPDTDLSDAGVLDTALDSLALRALERGRRGPIGPEPVVAYVLARQSEVVVLRVLLLGQLSGIDPETLRVRVNAIRG